MYRLDSPLGSGGTGQVYRATDTMLGRRPTTWAIDLSQFHHMMGPESHWSAEDQTLHAAYESAVDRRVDFMTHGSSLLDPFLTPVTVEGG